MINIGLWYVGEVPLESGRVLAGASRVLIFPVLRAVIMQALQGAREVLTAPGSRRQSQPFMSFSAGSLPNESVPFSRRARPLPDAGYQDVILLLKRPWSLAVERSSWPPRWFVLHLLLLLHVNISSFLSFTRSEQRSTDADCNRRINPTIKPR